LRAHNLKESSMAWSDNFWAACTTSQTPTPGRWNDDTATGFRNEVKGARAGHELDVRGRCLTVGAPKLGLVPLAMEMEHGTAEAVNCNNPTDKVC
jgi:hypothetical protein